MTNSIKELSALRRERLIRLYREEPEAYAEDVLKVVWWSKQIEIARSFSSGGITDAKASHGVGKTHLAGGLVNYCFDCWNDSITITTAPTARQVNDLLWKEVRKQRQGRPGLMPKAPRMETSESHFAFGFTATDANAFQGHHASNINAFFDESVGIDGAIFEATEGILSGGNARWLRIYNPTDISSRQYEEEVNGNSTVIQISALDHPNIIAGLKGEAEPYPGAVSLAWVKDKLEKWCERIDNPTPTDVEFPPGSGTWYRPGPLFESRVIGRWPSVGLDTIWSEALWDACLAKKDVPQEPLQIGCDVARFGDDWTTIPARRGSCLLHHERHNGWSIPQTVGGCKRVAKELCQEGEDPKKVLILVDDDGVGGGVVDMGKADGWNFVGLSAASKAIQDEDYPNRRSELWFGLHERAKEGNLDLSRLTQDQRRLVRRQHLTCKWKMDSQGRRVVESKEDMKKRLKQNNPDLMGGSPDDADGIHLAFAPPPRLRQWDF